MISGQDMLKKMNEVLLRKPEINETFDVFSEKERELINQGYVLSFSKFIPLQPERLSHEDKYRFGAKAEMIDGLCHLEDGTIIDPSQPIDTEMAAVMVGWISVKDMPPRKDIPIVIISKYRDIPTAVRWVEDGTYGCPGFYESNDEYEPKETDIIYWMALPPPPQIKPD